MGNGLCTVVGSVMSCGGYLGGDTVINGSPRALPKVPQINDQKRPSDV